MKQSPLARSLPLRGAKISSTVVQMCQPTIDDSGDHGSALAVNSLPAVGVPAVPAVPAEYVLDTSFVRKIPGELLHRANRNGVRLLVSPLAVWELLSHFDDEVHPFELCRGWMRKLGACEILEHPAAELLSAVGVAEHVPLEYRYAWLERVTARAIVAIFEVARDPKDVHEARFRDTQGNVRAVRECGRAAAEMRSRLQSQHREIGATWMTALEAELRAHGRDPRDADVFSDREYFDHIRREVSRIASTADTPTIAHLEERIFENAYVRLGHMIETVLFALRRRKGLDPNDYEDALICQAVDLATERVLVTADASFHGAVIRAHERYRRWAVDHAVPTRREPFVVGAETFIDRLVQITGYDPKAKPTLT